ncbi:MAG: hypothetical protein G01um10145_444 [Microgenomates group bacterium Gr01-1014_5]|nr:MAG: hypothetical protein G01um10145_444 [Microgenomates group bacterium Gr01-1014_5]
MNKAQIKQLNKKINQLLERRKATEDRVIPILTAIKYGINYTTKYSELKEEDLDRMINGESSNRDIIAQ